jgi:HlyD family secretion protein
LAAVLAGFALGGFCFYLYFREFAENPPADTGENHKSTESDKEEKENISALGRIEPMEGVLSLGVPTPDRILKMCVTEGQHVERGKKLVELESERLRGLEANSIEIQRQEVQTRRKATLDSGKAQIKVEEMRLKQAKELGPLEIEAQKSKIRFLQLQAANAKRDYGRLERLGDTIAEQDKEKQRLLWQQAEEELNAAEEQKKKLVTEQPLNVQMAEARRTAAEAEMERGLSTLSLNSLNNQAEQAKARREAAQVTAPSDGTILRLLAHEGELVQGKPIIQMANLDKMIVVAEVPTSSIPRVQKGDPATITSTVFDKLEVKLEGEVYFIRQIVGKPQVTDPNPLAPADYRIMEVKILLKQSKPANEYIGHEVKVSIQPRKRRNDQP